jgi:hypothetical protein
MALIHSNEILRMSTLPPQHEPACPPLRYMSLVSGHELTNREACLLILSSIVSDGLQRAWRELFNFLVVGVTKAANNLVGTCIVGPRLGFAIFMRAPLS